MPTKTLYENLQERINRSTMGMAASQGRLLFMTARISNNEFEQQCVAYSKQRLADDSQQANDQYLEALQATQYQILSGYNGDSPNYEPVTYNQLTSMNAVATRKQYIVSDNKGQILVTDKIAKAFDENYMTKGSGHSHSDFNTFLKKLGDYTQVEKASVTAADVHDAWDKYFTSVRRADKDGIYIDDETDHILGFTFHETKSKDGSETVSYVTSNSKYMIGGAGNKIYLNEKEDGTYNYPNFEIVAEALPENESLTLEYKGANGQATGQTKEIFYVAKFKPAHYDAELQDMMDDEGYVYIDPNYCFAEMEDGVLRFKWCAGAAKCDGDFDNYASTNDEQPKLYVDQDYNREDSVKGGLAGSLYHPYIVQSYTSTPNNKEGHDHSQTYGESNTIFYQGSTKEQRDLYDYAMAVSEKYAKGDQLTYDADIIQYYKNIYNQMITKGFTTFEKMLDEKYINTITYDNDSATTVGVSDEKQAYMNENWLINQLKCGKLFMAYYSSAEQGFVDTTLDDDESIVNKENKKKMAIAEQIYQTHMDRIESEDKRFDMQLTKLESEHTALTTEYESVAKVISKNVEKSFNTFSA